MEKTYTGSYSSRPSTSTISENKKITPSDTSGKSYIKRNSTIQHPSSSGYEDTSSVAEKIFNVHISPEMEHELRVLGQTRINALFAGSSDTKSTNVPAFRFRKKKDNLELYDCQERDIYTVKSVITMKGNVSEILQTLQSNNTITYRLKMEMIFDFLFLDGKQLFQSKQRKNEGESLCIHWMNLQSVRTNLPHRDYVYLQYSNWYEKKTNNNVSMMPTSNVVDEKSNVSLSHSDNDVAKWPGANNLKAGAMIWESIELNGCPSLPESTNTTRINLRKTGFLIESLTPEDNIVRIQFFISENHRGFKRVSNPTKEWLIKLAKRLDRLPDLVLARRLMLQPVRDDAYISRENDQTHCKLCTKKFGKIKRRKRACRLCNISICSSCSKTKKISGLLLSPTNIPTNNNLITKLVEVRICTKCTCKPSETELKNALYQSKRVENGTTFSSDSSPSLWDMTSNQPHTSRTDDSESVSSLSSSGVSDQSSQILNSTPNENQRFCHDLDDSTDIYNESVPIKIHDTAMKEDFAETPLFVPIKNSKKISNSVSNKGDMILLDSLSIQNTSLMLNDGTSDMILLDSNNRNLELLSEDKLNAEKSNFTFDNNSGVNIINKNTTYDYKLTYNKDKQEWPLNPTPENELYRYKKTKFLLSNKNNNKSSEIFTSYLEEMLSLASKTTNCPICSLCFLGDKTGYFVMKKGYQSFKISELPKNILIESHVIMSPKPTIVTNVQKDERFTRNPIIKNENIRFYAGFPLVSSEGFCIGVLSLASTKESIDFTKENISFLEKIAESIIKKMEDNTNITSNLKRSNLKDNYNSHENVHNGKIHSKQNNTNNGNMNHFNYKQDRIENAQLTMQKLLQTAYSTQCQVKMQASEEM